MAENPWAHRASPQHHGYNLRGTNPHGPIHPQRRKNDDAKRIRNGWPITRDSRRSRGLTRSGNTCFRLSGLQALLHLPKFLQWIISHNSMEKGTRIFPCRPIHVIQTELEAAMMSGGSKSSDDKKISNIDDLSEEELTQLEEKLKEKEAGKKDSTLTRCPACAVKALVLCYWGDQHMHASGQPNPLLATNPELTRVHDVDVMLRKFTPGAAVGAEDAQEDPEEMQTRLLTACLESVNYHHPANAAWKARYDALFILQLECIWRCATCDTVVQPPLPPGTNDDGIGFNNMAIHPTGTRDSVQDAIRRHFDTVDLGTRSCTQCNTPQQRTQTISIAASPEYLRIKLSIVEVVNKNSRKNFNPVALPNLLDLSRYQATGTTPSLKYKLSSVISHGGKGLTGGHWAASVRGPRQIFYIDDDRVERRVGLDLRANPQVHGGVNMQAVVLMYKRFPPK